MINEPAIDELTTKIGEKYEGSKYALCVVVAKRARQLIELSKSTSAVLDNNTPLTQAAIEISKDKITAIIG